MTGSFIFRTKGELMMDYNLADFLLRNECLTFDEAKSLCENSHIIPATMIVAAGISSKEAMETFDTLPESTSTSGFDIENGQINEPVKKKRYHTIDEQVEAQWGNRQSILRSAVNRFWKEKLKH